MANKVVKSSNDCCEKYETSQITNGGEYYDPFMYGFYTPVGYTSKNKDKYVSSGSYNSETEEIDLKLHGSSEEVKISVTGLSAQDEYVRSGESTITEDEQNLTLKIGDSKGTTSEVKVDLSGMKDSFATKTELDENKPKWEEF